MKTNIMVPVNGSNDGQSIVPLLQSLLDQGGVGKVTLVRVVPLAPVVAVDYPLEYADVMAADTARREEAETFLRGVAEKISWGFVEHEIIALQGNEAETLARFAAVRRFDSVLIMPRKRSWIGRVFSTSISDRILDAACVPITMLPGSECIAHQV